MAEILRSADPGTIKAAVDRMAEIVQGLDGLVGQLQASIDASRRIGEGVPPVSIFLGPQVAGKSMLKELEGALDSLTVLVTRGCDFGCGPDSARDPRLAVPVLGSEVQAEVMGGGHA